MKRVYLFLFLATFFSVAWAESGTTGNVNAFLGNKSLDSADWAPLDSQAEFGVLIDVAGPKWPVSVAIDLLGSTDEENIIGIDFTGSTSELDLGLRKVFELTGSPFHPYIGGGLAFITAKLEGSLAGFTVSDEDRGTGVWISGGFFVTLGENFNLGIDLRHSDADVTLFGIDTAAGGDHAGILLGYHW